MNKQRDKRLSIFFAFICVLAISNGLVDGVLSNYFKEVYNADAFMRGVIEFPRESPGVLCIFFLSALAFLGDIRSGIVAAALAIFGSLMLGLVTPPFAVMLVFIFIHSLGTHMLMPLQDGIGISFITDEKTAGKRIGQYTGLKTGFTMVAALIVFVGFRTGFFSFSSKIKWVFVAASATALCALVLIAYLARLTPSTGSTQKRFRLQLHREYSLYYALCILAGAQKQIMLVYAPWVIIEILGKGADTMALLGIVASFIGIFFIQAIGRCVDRFGLKPMLYADALSFIAVYIAYGILTQGFESGRFSTGGIAAILTMGLFILDRMSMQFSIVRTAYLRSIAKEPSHITSTISAGISMDHVVSIIFASICGLIWTNFGAHYVFYMLAIMSILNVVIAAKVKTAPK